MTDTKTIEQTILRGIGVSSGIAIGRAIVLEGRRRPVTRRLLDVNALDGEAERFRTAVEGARQELFDVKQRASALGDVASFLDAHILMLDDDSLVGETLRQVRQSRVNVEWALAQVVARIAGEFLALDDELFRDRARDIEDVGDRLQRQLSGASSQVVEADGEYVLVAHDPSPSETARLDPNHILGIAIDAGGRTSHTGIIAKSLEIPAIVGLGDVTQQVRTGDLVIVDGIAGEVRINPSDDVAARYRLLREEHLRHDEELRANWELDSVTADGHKVFLQANIDLPNEVESAVHHGAEGIGLYRSEFLYVNIATAGPPSEDEQYEVYRALAERVAPRSAIVRTIDFGGGKVSPESPGREANPIMGLRAIRYCLAHPELFKSQLRALLRASQHGRLKIMFPLITSVAELRSARALLDTAKAELRAEGKRFNDRLSVGIMIEVPAAAAIADLLAQEVDFFSIGTNDLIQFQLAVDRDNADVSYLYEPLHPGVLRVLKSVIDAAHSNDTRVGMCGEMASDPTYVALLVGMGLDELSMNPVSIPRIKRLIRVVRYDEARELVRHVLHLATVAEIQAHLRAWSSSHLPSDWHHGCAS